MDSLASLLTSGSLADIELYVVEKSIDPLSTVIWNNGSLSITLVGAAFSMSRKDLITRYMRGIMEVKSSHSSILDILIASRNPDTIAFLDDVEFDILITYDHLFDAVISQQDDLVRYIMNRLPPNSGYDESYSFTRSLEYTVIVHSTENLILDFLKWRAKNTNIKFANQLLCYAADRDLGRVRSFLKSLNYSCRSSPGYCFPDGVQQDEELAASHCRISQYFLSPRSV
jgi:hypothetical protein